MGPTATLVVRIVDQRDRPLQPALILTGYQFGPVHGELPVIDGYILTDIQGFTQTFLSEYGLMTLIYTKEQGQPLLTYYLDYDNGQLLKLPDFRRGILGAPYASIPPEFPNYRIFQAHGDHKGHFSRHPNQMTYFYRRDDWDTVQRVHQFMELLTDHVVYDAPAGNPYNYQFPATSIWRVFVIITLHNHDEWLNLGGDQWIPMTDVERRDGPVQPELPHHTWTPQPFDRLGVVDYVPHQAVTVFEEPYGESNGEIENGATLEIRGRIIDDQQLVWYQIGPNTYINARYTHLLPTETI
ncbi:MucBP domain-containing protein [Levilactobacillus senmaizukei]|uniref:MucBP domain-containing protein n=1 Tax=Levilactobacillus senmaizukei TaxID=431273 RepID=UPI001F227095|nr:MucBP domain-containing protein [Levilactobacillus senmaizukei]